MSVYQLIESCESEYCGVTLGGGAFIDSTWPINPNGEKMALLLSIDNDLLNNVINNLNLPCGMKTHVFSTYSDERYFLDDIVYFGDDIEFSYIKKGFTKVIMTESHDLVDENFFDGKRMGVKLRSLNDIEYPTFSFISDKIPASIFDCNKLVDEYRFVCQVYSADIPSRDGGALGLSDAIGYLFLRKKIIDYSDAGFFFVQSA